MVVFCGGGGRDFKVCYLTMLPTTKWPYCRWQIEWVSIGYLRNRNTEENRILGRKILCQWHSAHKSHNAFKHNIEQMNKLFGHNLETLNVEDNGRYSYHLALFLCCPNFISMMFKNFGCFLLENTTSLSMKTSQLMLFILRPVRCIVSVC